MLSESNLKLYLIFIARYINHECSTGNLTAKQLQDKNGFPRIILVAKIDIPPGVELTYDYRTDKVEGEKETLVSASIKYDQRQ